MSIDLDELDEEIKLIIESSPNHPMPPQARHNRGHSYSWDNLPTTSAEISKMTFQLKLLSNLPFSLILVVSFYLFAKFELSFYHFIAIWFGLFHGYLLVLLYRVFSATRVREIRTRVKPLDGFSKYTAFTYALDDKPDKPLTSICMSGGVRGSTQELLFVQWVMGSWALGMVAVGAKTFERGKDLFTSNSWDQGRRTDIALFLLYPVMITDYLLYISGAFEHGTAGLIFHRICATVAAINSTFAFMVSQNFSAFSIICAFICYFGIAVFRILDKFAPERSDDPTIVHKWSLIWVSVEAAMVISVNTINILNVWSFDGDYIYFQ